MPPHDGEIHQISNAIGVLQGGQNALRDVLNKHVEDTREYRADQSGVQARRDKQVDDKLSGLETRVDSIESKVDKAKGAWWALGLAGSIGGGLTALALKLVPWGRGL